MKKDFDHFYGCLAGGAFGDALGEPVEMMSYKEIIDAYGSCGITPLNYVHKGTHWHVTDDTQMTLFTAEGILRSATRAKRKEEERSPKETAKTIFRAYLRWLYTQGLATVHWKKKDYDGWLMNTSKLYAYREASVTCITSLGRGMMGKLEHPLNNSKGCGGVMRVAPIGLVEETGLFEIGCRVAAITHGHPLAYLPAGAMCVMINEIIKGVSLEEAICLSIDRLRGEIQGEECVKLLERAVKLANEGSPSTEKIESLGSGFLGHEALSIAVYAVLSYPNDLEKAVLLAVNHSGDSDTTGSMTGQLLGAYLGAGAIDERWLRKIEVDKEIRRMSCDLLTFYDSEEKWLLNYPAW